MKYQEHFDRCGNPYHRRPSRVRIHRVLQALGIVASIVVLVLIYR